MRSSPNPIRQTTNRPDPPDEVIEHGRGTRDSVIDGRSCAALADLGLMAAGFSDIRPGYRGVRRRPGFDHVSACCGGRGLQYFVGGRWRRARAGDAVLAPRGSVHGARLIAGRARMVWVLFDPHSRRAPTLDIDETRLLQSVDYRPLWWAVRGLHREHHGPADPAALRHWAALLATAAARLAGREAGDAIADRHRLGQLWEAVDADLARPWTVPMLAEMASLSTTHLTRLCRARLGRGPMAHVAELRLRRAATLLTTTDHKLATIAAAVGYATPFALSAAFARWAGTPPQAYRARQASRQ